MRTPLTPFAARSPPPPPVSRVHHPERSSLRILPRGGANGLSARSRFAPSPKSLRHDDTLLLTVSVPSLLSFDVNLLLNPTEHLLQPNAQVTFESTGESIPLRAEDWRLYNGQVIRPHWVERTWVEEAAGMGRNPGAVLGRASVMVHEVGDNDVVWEGVFTVLGTTYNVMTRENYRRVKTADDANPTPFGDDLVIFSDADMVPRNGSGPAQSCSHDNLAFNVDVNHPVRRSLAADIFERSDMGGTAPSTNYINDINSTTGCPTSQQIVYMGVAVDCNYVGEYGTAEAARTKVLNNWNSITALYKSTFKISLGITEIVVMDATCPSTAPSTAEWNTNCSASVTLDDRLSLFSTWRGNRSDDGIGLWTLMTACQTDTEVGVAWLGQVCTTDANTQTDGTIVSGTGVASYSKTEWNIIAHEIGHGFGAIHDCESGCSLSGSCCPYSTSSCDANGAYIMNPTTGSTETTFSACTLGNVCTFLGSNSKSCIVTPDSSHTIISLNQCGNGIVEDGEDCDPGSNSTSSCCTSDCKFTSGAVCDPFNSACCTDSCGYAASTVVCRASINSICDQAEYCTGTNATCPTDVTAADGTSCGSDGLACASGHCTSLNAQCVAAGTSLNLTTACGQRNDKTCMVVCKTPNATNMCTELQTVLIDGSPCGYGGHCYSGVCKAGSWQDTFKAWYRQNLNISIPVTIAVGLIVLFILYSISRCICGCFRPRTKAMPMTRTNGRGGRDVVTAPPLVATYQPIDPNMHSRQQSLGLSPTSPAGGNPNDGHAMGQLGGYHDPYSNVNVGYGAPYGGQPGGGNNGWVDAEQYNGPSYPDDYRRQWSGAPNAAAGH